MVFGIPGSCRFARTGAPDERELDISFAMEQFQEKCEAVFRPELRQNKELERLSGCDSYDMRGHLC
ncbi:hypothetical protein HB777_30790 [Mesorhizobium loti]|nr:hypothetical protein HB777_30790 [Mesorhizobium loti]